MFSGKQGDQGGRVFDEVIPPEIGGGANPFDIKKATKAIESVSGEQILGSIVAATKTVKSGGEEPKGKNADEATNPIEAAIGEMTIRMLLHSRGIWKKIIRLLLLLF